PFAVETDLFTLMRRVRSRVDDALRFVNVAVQSQTSCECRSQRLMNVHHMQIAVARLRAFLTSGRVKEAGVLIDGDGVRTRKEVVVRVFRENDRRGVDAAETFEIKDLQSVTARFAADECVVAVDLHIAPQ